MIQSSLMYRLFCFHLNSYNVLILSVTVNITVRRKRMAILPSAIRYFLRNIGSLGRGLKFREVLTFPEKKNTLFPSCTGRCLQELREIATSKPWSYISSRYLSGNWSRDRAGWVCVRSYKTTWKRRLFPNDRVQFILKGIPKMWVHNYA